MYIDTYVTTDDNQKLNKTLTNVDVNVTCVLKDDTEFIEPVLIMSNNCDQDFNYVYISAFDRYYFVVSRTYSQQKYYVKLQVDVLMSFNDAISDLTVVANRSYSHYNLYQVDGKIPRTADDIIKTQPFRFGFGNPSFILAVNGG